MISVRDVCASHPGGGRVLHDVTLDVEAGGVTALIGPNGAGKSTLLAVMARLLEPESGQVLLDGRDVRRTPGAETARRMAVLRQDTHLAVRLTVRELVALGRFPHSGGRLTGADRELVARAVEDVDLVEMADRRLDRLSGGQRQRAHLAMALCQISSGQTSSGQTSSDRTSSGQDVAGAGGYLLLDEPLAALDLKHSVRVMRLLRQRARERGLTVVVVVHDVNFAAAHADRVVAMADGRVVTAGPTAEVITGPVLGALYGTEVTVHDVAGQRFAAYHA